MLMMEEKMSAAAAGGCLVAALALAGCGETGTNLEDLVNVSPFADAGDDGAASATGEAGAFIDPFGGAPPYAATASGSSHNAGMACLAAGCHATSGGAGGAPNFVFGGTVYADYQGQTAAPGVEVRAVDAQGKSVSVFSGPEGNFYLLTSNANGLSFPIVVGARNATMTRPMITTLTASNGACGQTTCHVPGGGSSTSTGNYYPIHLP
jgi:hypothetical protein